jgi:hypothetical protein
MSGYLPANTTLTLGDASGNITYTGTVSSSNITTMTSNIATNTSNIATNTANIATNTSNIATNTSNIATNTSNIATNTSNIATNTSNINSLTILQVSPLIQYSSPAIYADGRPPSAVPASITNSYAYSGWYFKNTTAGYKINWYFGVSFPTMTVGDILGMYVSFFNGNNTSNDNTPFITIYTTPTGSGDYAPGFFHSACTYIYNPASSISANSRYTEFLNASGTCPTPQHYGNTLVSMVSSPVSNPRGTYLPTQTVEFFSIGTNSVAPTNGVEIVISKVGVMTASGTTEIQLMPLI